MTLKVKSCKIDEINVVDEMLAKEIHENLMNFDVVAIRHGNFDDRWITANGWCTVLRNSHWIKFHFYYTVFSRTKRRYVKRGGT